MAVVRAAPATHRINMTIRNTAEAAAKRSNPTRLARARFLVGTEAATAIRTVAAAMADELDTASGRGVDAERSEALMALAARLRARDFDPTLAVSESLARSTLRTRLVSTGRAKPDFELTADRTDSIEDRLLVAAVAAAIRRSFGSSYEAYAQRVLKSAGDGWGRDDMNPLGSHALALAALSAVAGLGTAASAHRELCAAMCRHLAEPLARTLLSADDVLRGGATATHRTAPRPAGVARDRRDHATRPGPSLERLVGERIRDLLSDRLSECQVPATVREFLLDAWLRHLRTAALRDGEQSARFREAMAVVDDLVGSLDAAAGSGGRDLAQRIAPLVRSMTQGVREIGANADEYRPFFDELFVMHLRRLQSGESEQAGCTDAAPAASGDRRQQASERVARRSSASSGGRATGAEARSQAAAPADVDLHALADATDFSIPLVRRRIPAVQAWVDLAPGEWFELIETDGASRIYKLLWINGERSIALLVRRDDRRTLLFNAQGLESRFAHGRAFLLDHAV